MISERGLIDKIKQAAGGNADLVQGIGDDCAVFRGRGDTLNLVSVDTLAEGVHFDLSWHPAAQLGRKAAAVNISDIAAMGGRGTFMLLSISAPSSTPAAWLDDFIGGFLAELGRHGVTLIGGDTVASHGGLSFSITALGEVAAHEVIYRSGAAAGDLVLVSGPLGDAAMGLAICRAGRADLKAAWPELIAAHLTPVAELELGRLLAASGLVTAMLDMSDGLATDLAHLCECSGLAAGIEAAALPVSGAARQAAQAMDMDILRQAVSGGEDYRLLFTCPAKDADKLERLARDTLGRELFRIGKMAPGAGVNLSEQGRKRRIDYQGYDHFVV
jgi:thiamine-monophosphate kinase